MKPEDRLAEARKLLKLAAEDDEVSKNQEKAIRGVVDIATALEDSIRVQRDNQVMTDGGFDEAEVRYEAVEQNIQWLRENGIEGSEAQRRLAMIRSDIDALGHLSKLRTSDERRRVGEFDE